MLQVIAQVAVRLVVFLGLAIVGFAIEDQLHARKPSRAYHAGLVFNGVCTVIYFVTQATVGAVALLALSALVGEVPGAGLVRIPTELTGWQIGLATFGWLAVRDFFYYWLHRAQHHVSWLWAIHELHHSDEHLNVTTTFRHHWLQAPLDHLAVNGPLLYLFVPSPSVVMVTSIAGLLLAHFIHLNARISLNGVGWLIANPQHHRIHHSNDPRHLDQNFTTAFPLWDVLFGTYYRGREEYPQTGIIGGSQALTASDAVVLPFRRWWTLTRRQEILAGDSDTHLALTGGNAYPAESSRIDRPVS